MSTGHDGRIDFRLIDSGWGKVIDDALNVDHSEIRIICPFIKKKAAERLLAAGVPRLIEIITRFNLADFFAGVSDTSALRLLINKGATVRKIKNLHSKLYLFGGRRVILTSANLTDAALSRNHEFGFISDKNEIITRCREYFDDLWRRAGTRADLTSEELGHSEATINAALQVGGQLFAAPRLTDNGIDLGFMGHQSTIFDPSEEITQSFVKFFGEGHNRADRDRPVIDEINRSGCHWACTYPKGKRPRQVEDGAILFMGRLVKNPNDTIIYGRAIGMQHRAGRDDATIEEIKLREWKGKWPHYIRVHHAEFVAGTLENGVSLFRMMDTLGPHAFSSTEENAERKLGNTDPRRAIRQQAAIRLTSAACIWITRELDLAFKKFGKVELEDLKRLDWPRNNLLLSSKGRQLLHTLVHLLDDDSVNIHEPKSFPSYKDILIAMGTTPRGIRLGSQFAREGGLELNEWLRQMHLPALTGLVVSRSKGKPGDGYFIANGRRSEETEWWLNEIQRAKAIDWSSYR